MPSDNVVTLVILFCWIRETIVDAKKYIFDIRKIVKSYLESIYE